MQQSSRADSKKDDEAIVTLMTRSATVEDSLIEQEKKSAAIKAADIVIEEAKQSDETTIVGLGTGSTAAYAIERIGSAVKSGVDIKGVQTSFQTKHLAHKVGVPLVDLSFIDKIDYAIDGADQFAGRNLIKGGGAAHAREWIVDTVANELHIVVDSTKESGVLDHFVPIELEEDALTFVKREVCSLGGEPELRTSGRKDGPTFTDNHFLILDCEFGVIQDPEELAKQISNIPGVFRHGLFVNMVDHIHIGSGDTVETREL